MFLFNIYNADGLRAGFANTYHLTNWFPWACVLFLEYYSTQWESNQDSVSFILRCTSYRMTTTLLALQTRSIVFCWDTSSIHALDASTEI